MSNTILAITLFTLIFSAPLNAQKHWFREFGKSVAGYQEITPLSDSSFAIIGSGVNMPLGSTFSLTLLGSGAEKEVQFPQDPAAQVLYDYVGLSVGKASDGVLMSGALQFANQETDIMLCKSTTDGNQAWGFVWPSPPGCRIYAFEPYEGGISIRETQDGGIVLLGVTDLFETSKPARLLRLDHQGNLLWSEAFGHALSAVRPLPDQGLYLFGDTLLGTHNGMPDRRLVLMKTDAQGKLLWKRHTAVRAGAGYMEPVNQNAENKGVFLSCQYAFVRADEQGQLMWADSSLPFTALPAPDEWFDPQLPYTLATGAAVKADGRCVGVGLIREGQWSHIFVRQYAPDGAVEWTRLLRPFQFSQDTLLPAVCIDPDGSIVVSGHRRGGGVFLLKMGEKGSNGTITGRAVQKMTPACQPDPSDIPLVGWLVRATDQAGNSYFAVTDETGEYGIWTPGYGTYQVALIRPSPAWGLCDAQGVDIDLSASNQHHQVLLFARALADCPALSVELGADGWRKGYARRMVVQYSNSGAVAAPDARLFLKMDPLLSIISAFPLSYTYDAAQHVYAFDLGSVPSGALGKISLMVKTSPDAEAGDYLCVESHIYPDTGCLNIHPSVLILEDSCRGDTAYVSLLNTGPNPLTSSVSFVIAVDNIIKDTLSTSLLLAGERQTFAFPLLEGSLIFRTLNNDGSQLTTVIEACNGVQTNQPAYLNQYAQEDGNPFTEKLCAEVRSSFDPNDKLASPEGVGENHHILPETEIRYTIRFENTGNDTAFTVLVTDTLSALLDFESFRAGVSSHNHELQASGDGERQVLRFIFSDIRLPHEPGLAGNENQGFVQYFIRPKSELPLEAQIENKAHIYFDFNPAIQTNTVWHSISKLLFTKAQNLLTHASRLRIVPNPASETMWIQADLPDVHLIKIMDTQGRIVADISDISRSFLEVKHWNTGVYFVLAQDSKGRLLAINRFVRP